MAQLYASAARRRITPSEELVAKWNKKTSKHFSAPVADIYMQAIAFSDKQGHTLVHVGGDIIMTFGSELRDVICKEHSLPDSCLFFSCTHNHMIPDMLRPGQQDNPNGGGFGVAEGGREWTDFVFTQAQEAVRDAIRTLRPARIGAGHGSSGLSVNREWDTPVGSLGTGDRNGDTLHEISVLRVDELDGKPIAVLVNSNCHAGSFFGGNVGLDHRIVSGDVAGWVSQFVGNAIGHGVVPVWAIGGAGDQNTYFHSGMMWPSVDEKGQFYKESYVMKDEDAIALARNAAAMQSIEVLNVYHGITQFSSHFDLKTGIVYKTGTRIRDTRRGPGGPGGPGGPPNGPPASAVPLAPAPAAAGPVQYDDVTFRFYLITLNGIAFAGANSESFIGLKRAARGVLPFDEQFYIDMNNDDKARSAGYVPSPRFDPLYDKGRRHNLQGAIMPYNGNDMLRLYADGFSELVKTIS